MIHYVCGRCGWDGDKSEVVYHVLAADAPCCPVCGGCDQLAQEAPDETEEQGEKEMT